MISINRTRLIDNLEQKNACNGRFSFTFYFFGARLGYGLLRRRQAC
jgi:hypothetical protein